MISLEGLARAAGAAAISWASSIIPAVQGQPYDWGWGYHPMMWGAWGFGMMIMMLLFWALIIIGVVLGIRWLLGQGKSPHSDSALEILRQRYARGEIDKEEFDTKKKDLMP